jgi:Mn2+/Fe2+ NRAMP family transporter
VSGLLDITLGIMTALGGFVDIGELVFALAAGAKFGYGLLWAVVVGTIGIAVYGEMAGRIAAVLQKPTFTVVKERMGANTTLMVLVASVAINVLTCAAEIGGLAVVLQLLGAHRYQLMVLAAAGILLLSVYLLPFRWIERVFGLLGLPLLVYVVAAASLQPDWKEAARGLLPASPGPDTPGLAVYLYFAVGLLSSILMPYEIYFYSSGAIEEGWKPKDLPVNKLTAGIGFLLGGLLCMALIVVGAALFKPAGVDPQTLGTTLFGASVPLGHAGFLVALVGVFFAIAGAAVETALSAAYNVTQFLGVPWGKRRKPREVPCFTAAWIATILLGLAIACSGVNPVQIVEYAVLFAVLVLPFTYYPVLRLADDRKAMGKHANAGVIRWLGWAYLVLICVVALAAVPLMVLTHNGQG